MAQEATRGERLVSLDVFRGITIASMILVNNPGTWSHMFKPLGHAQWHGWTPTDFIFPFFLFIVGVAMTFSFDKRLAKGASRVDLMAHVIGRSAVIFLLGMIGAGFPNFRLIGPYILGTVGIEFLLVCLENATSRTASRNMVRNLVLGALITAVALIWFLVDFRYFNGPAARGNWSDFFPLKVNDKDGVIRVVGVLQRIAIVYVVASLIMMFTRSAWARFAWVVGLIGAYWLVMALVQAPAGYVLGGGAPNVKPGALPGDSFPGLLNDWIDVKLLGRHLYTERPDPEGLLSTIPAIATTLLGILTGMHLRRTDIEPARRARDLMLIGVAMLVVGQLMHYGFPINKKIWSSSYVIFMGGWANLIFGLCYLTVDVAGYRRWTPPFLVFGTNAIVAFFCSGIMSRCFSLTKWATGEVDAKGEPVMTNIKSWSYGLLERLYLDPDTPTKLQHNLASMTWALGFVILWMLILTPLYRKRIFIKV